MANNIQNNSGNSTGINTPAGSSSAPVNNKIKFEEPRNPLDPIVVFDPDFEFSNIAMPYMYDDENRNSISGQSINTLNIYGVKVPIIKLNNKIIDAGIIYSMVIELTDFLPKISLTVNDDNRNIQATDVPGMNNVITVILIAPIDGANKKISMDFYITSCIFNDDNTITYIGEFKFNELKQVKYTQIGKEKLSTYDMLKEIAKESKLGFACTKKCEEIKDLHWRQIYSETYVDYIKQELSYAGVDEESIFDAWIDNFGYLVMVNIANIMNEPIKAEQLSIKVIEGLATVLPDNAVPEPKIEEVYRVITNLSVNSAPYNLYFTEYHSIVDNSKILKKGTANKYYYLSSPGESNLITLKELNVQENSVDGEKGVDDYKYENIEFIGSLQSDDEEGICKIYQKQIIENFYNKINAKKLRVILEDANYSLQRGMLVNVIIEEYLPETKQFIEQNIGNTVSDGSDVENTEAEEVSAENKLAIVDENNGMINPGLSGVYYIADMSFEYIYGNVNIRQSLTLIKKGIQNNLTNKYTSVKSPNDGSRN